MLPTLSLIIIVDDPNLQLIHALYRITKQTALPSLCINSRITVNLGKCKFSLKAAQS